MKAKKILALLLSTAMVVMTACGSGGNEGGAVLQAERKMQQQKAGTVLARAMILPKGQERLLQSEFLTLRL